MSAAPSILIRTPTTGEQYRSGLQRTAYDFPRVPVPIYRHAAPSAPWPWMDVNKDESEVKRSPARPGEWKGYPQNLFGNWTPEQVKRSQMLTKCSNRKESIVYKFDVFHHGKFDEHERVETLHIPQDDPMALHEYWKHVKKVPHKDVRVRVLFVEDMTKPILQILGTRYNIEPFFFSSSVNWIPSRYQEDPTQNSDHITLVIPFMRTLKKQRPVNRARPWSPTSASNESQSEIGYGVEVPLPYMAEKHTIDTQAAIALPDKKIILQDLLSLHMVRTTTTSTIISYHPSLQVTSASRLYRLAHRTGDSVYWQKIFNRSKDPTFLLLAILWYALYEWDESLEYLHEYISALEHKAIKSEDIKLAQELHKLQAHLLNYRQLLDSFLLSVKFVKDKPNPAMNVDGITPADREDSENLLKTEADNLISEIERLGRQREMLNDRISNAIGLTLAIVKIKETRGRHGLVETTLADTATTKIVSYLAMLFLPGAYLANVFRMNVREVHPPSHAQIPISHYIEAVIALTLFTLWLGVALQRECFFFTEDSSPWHRTFWPIFFLYSVGLRMKERVEVASRRIRRNPCPPEPSPTDKERSD